MNIFIESKAEIRSVSLFVCTCLTNIADSVSDYWSAPFPLFDFVLAGAPWLNNARLK